MNKELIPIVGYDKVLLYFMSNIDILIIYTLTSSLVEALCFKLAYKNNIYKQIFYLNLISSPIAWTFNLIAIIPNTYSFLIGNLYSIIDWDTLSLTYYSIYMLTFILMSYIIEKGFLDAIKVKLRNLKIIIIFSNIISLTVYLAILSLL